MARWSNQCQARAECLLRHRRGSIALQEIVDRRLRATAMAPILARLIDAVCDSGEHQRALTAMLRGLARFLEAES